MQMSQRLGPVLAWAKTNHLLIPTSRLIEAGFSYRQVSEIRRDGMLERLIRGLYRVPGSWSPLQDAAAATSRHTGATASHTTALWLHDFEIAPPTKPHFTIAGPTATGRTGFGQLHRSRLDPVDLTTIDGVAVTTMERAIVDSASLLPVRQLSPLLDFAVSSRRTRIAAVLSTISRLEPEPGRRGCARLREALSPWTEAIVPDSPAEARAIRRIVDFGLMVPDTQFVIRDASENFVARVDLAWPSHRVAREYDSDRFHGPGRIEHDEARMQRIEATGWSVEAISRVDLRPSETRWLNRLARDLRAQT